MSADQKTKARVLYEFLAAESGAVTVDWVVLTAAMVGLGIGVATTVRTGTLSLGNDIQSSLGDAAVASLDCLGTNDGPAGFACYSGPTIVGIASTETRFFAGNCSFSGEGVMVCSPSGTEVIDLFVMSDGQTYQRNTITAGDTTTVQWYDSNGMVTDEPPPV